jgi:hypothetical protein
MTEQTEMEVVYLGRAILQGNKPGTRWILKSTLDATQADESSVRRVASIFSGKAKALWSPGSVYQTRATSEGDSLNSMSFSHLKFVGRSDHPTVPAFEAAEINMASADRARKAERDVKANPVILRELNQTAAMLRKMPFRQRMAAVDAIRSELMALAMKEAR